MSKKTFYVLMAVSMISIPGFSAQERVVKVQNSVRFGYDDNIYQTKDKEESAYITDILNITGKFNMSGRTDAVLYWQPEVRYRFDADPDTVTYQDFYAALNHAMSQRVFLTISDRLRYQTKNGQSGDVDRDNQEYLENALNGAVDVDLDEVSLVKFGGGYTIRRWDDSTYGEDLSNDFDRFLVNASYIRRLNQNKTSGVLSINYVDQQYDGSRDGYQATTLSGGVDQIFNPNLSGFGRAGATMSSVDQGSGSNDNTTPYFDAGLTYNPSERTSINGSMGYSLNYSENSIYNAQEEYNFRLGVRHDLTAKINIASSIAYIFSMYDSDYAYLEIDGLGDTDEHYVRVDIRATYQINRNNFVEVGYQYSDRDADSDFLADYDRNTVDIGWRLRL